MTHSVKSWSVARNHGASQIMALAKSSLADFNDLPSGHELPGGMIWLRHELPDGIFSPHPSALWG